MTSVAFVLWTSQIGGAERQTADLARSIAAMGATPRILVLGPPGPLQDLADPVPVRTLDVYGMSGVMRNLGRVRAALTGADIVVLPSNGFLAVACRGVAPILVSMEHGDALNAQVFDKGRRAVRRIGRALGASGLDCEIAVSRFAEEALLQMPHASRVEVIHNGIDTSRFRPRDAKESAAPVVASLSRLVEGKGVDVFLEAGRLVGVPIEVVVAGDGEARDALERQARQLEIPARFVGRVDDVPAFWSTARVGVFASDGLRESFCLAALEALSCGVTIVVRDSPLVDELLAHAPGVVRAPDCSPESLARAIEAAIGSKPISDDERQRRHDWVADRFGIEASARRYMELFEVLGGSSN